MKTKLYRVLVMLLAIAMMIPSFAFAEDAAKTPTFTLTGADTPIEVKMGDNIVTSGITWEVKDLPTGSALQNAKILWTVTSDNNSTFSLDKDEDPLKTDVSGKAVPEVTYSNFKKNKEDVTDSTATVTGKLVVNSKDIVSKSFTVKVSKVDVTSIDFTDTAKKDKANASAGDSVDLTADDNINLVVPDKCSFDIDDVVFSVVSGGDYADITSTGSLYIHSNTPNDTKIKVRAYIPGSKVAGYTASKAEIEITVVGQYEPDDPQDAAKDAYTFIGFTVDKDTGNVYTIDAGDDPSTKGKFYFNDYLTALGNTTGVDKLVWQVDDPTKATLANEVTNNANNTLTFTKTNVAAKVKVTVKSKNDPTVTDYCYVQFVPAEKKEDKGYTNVKFAPYNSKTVIEGNDGDDLDLDDYLVYDVDEDTSDVLLWSDDKGLISDAMSGDISSYYLKVENSPITVTVRSKQNASETDKFTITVVKADADPGYTKVEFAQNELTVKNPYTDILPYLTLEGDTGKPSDLIFTSSDESIANVTPFIFKGSFQGLYVAFTSNAKDGDKVTISVRNTRSSKTAEPSTITLTYSKTEADKEEYTIGFVKDSIDVAQSVGSIDLKDYVYIQDKDGKAVSASKAETVLGKLIWTTENADVASVTNGVVTFNQNKKGADATATISIRYDYAVKELSSIKVNFKKDAADDENTFTSLAFREPKTVTVEWDGETETFDALDYLLVTTKQGNADRNLIESELGNMSWTSSDETVASVTDGAVVLRKDGEVEINVRYAKDAVKFNDTLKIKVVKAEEKAVFEKLGFIDAKDQVATIDTDNYTFDAMSYLVLKGNYNNSDVAALKWFSSDDTIATVSQGTVTFATMDLDDDPDTDPVLSSKIKDGDKVSITVRYEYGDNQVMTDTLNLTVKRVPAKPYKDLKFIQDKLNVLSSNTELDLYDFLTYSGNDYGEDDLIWTSENQQIAKVNEDGEITVGSKAADGDTVKITVRSKVDSTQTASITLTIKKDAIKFTKITLTQDTFTLEPDGSIYLGRYVVTEPAESPDDTLFYTSDDPSVVIHDNEAKTDADLKEDGEAHITVRSTLDPTVSAKFTIILKAKGVETIEFKDAPKTFYDVTKKLDLKDYLVTKPVEYSRANLKWDSSDPSAATVDNGVVTWKQSADAVTITVTDKISGKSANVVLALKEKHPVESIALKDITMDVDDGSYVLDDDFLTYAPLNASFSTNNITWTSSNRDVAEVVDPKEKLENGETRRDNTRGPKLVAYKAGTTKIKAYYELEDGTVLEAQAIVTVNDVELSGVKIAEDKYTLKLNTKTSTTVRFNVEPFNCTFKEEDLYVVSADSSIVEVSKYSADTTAHKGMFTITGKKPGTAWVVVKRAKDDKALDACKVKVKAVAVKTVKWEKDSVKMYYYDDGKEKEPDKSISVTVKQAASNTVYKNKLAVTPIINPVEAYCKVSFETSDPSVAFINNDDVLDFTDSKKAKVDLICVGPGTCKITMKVDDGKKVRKAVMKVEVLTKLPKMKMSQSKATLKLEKGKDTLQLRAYDANTDTDMDVKWTSSNKKVVKVNAEGKVRAIAAGTATITATTKNGQKQVVKCKITVKAPSTKNDAAKKITGDTKVTVKAGEKKTLEIKVKPEGAKVTFTSSDSKIVKVTKDGTIKGIKAGKATITVKAAEGKAELKIKVVVK